MTMQFPLEKFFHSNMKDFLLFLFYKMIVPRSVVIPVVTVMLFIVTGFNGTAGVIVTE